MKTLKSIVLKSLFALTFGAHIAIAQEAATSNDAPQPGQTYVKSVEGDWIHRCVKLQSGSDPCHLFQRVIFNNDSVIAEAQVVPLTDGGAAVAGITVTVPLGTALQAPLRFQIDEREAKLYPYAYCTAQGCVANVGLTALELRAMQKGSQGLLTIVSIRDPQNPVQVPLSLNGFSAAYNAISQ